MVSFLKRRKSSAVAEEKRDTRDDRVPALPPNKGPTKPSSQRNDGSQIRQQKSAQLAMPDLRFSAMNLDADVMSAGATSLNGSLQAGRPPSRQFLQQQQHLHQYHQYQQQQQQPQSRHQQPQQHHQPGLHQNQQQLKPLFRADEFIAQQNMAKRPTANQNGTASPHSHSNSPKSSAAMYAALPGPSEQASPINAKQRQQSAPPKSQARMSAAIVPPAAQTPVKDKKQLKREEKERATMEKERSKQAAKDNKAADKGHKSAMDDPRARASDMQKQQRPPSSSRSVQSGSGSVHRPQSTTSSVSQWTIEPDTQSYHSRTSSIQAYIPQYQVSPPRVQSSVSQMRLSTPPDTKLNARSAYSRISQQMSQDPITGSPLAGGSDAASQKPSRPPLTVQSRSKDAVMTTSSSEGGNSSTSTADRVRPGSSETATSIEGDNATSSFITSDEKSGSAQSPEPSIHRARPARDNEREERAQSRLSMRFDFETAKNANETAYSTAENSSNALSSMASAQTNFASLPSSSSNQANASPSHQRNESNASKMSTFSAMLMASRPGGAADRSVDQIQREAAAAEAEAKQRQMREEYYRRTTQPTQTSLMERFEGVNDRPVQASAPQTRADSVVKRVRESVPITPPRRRYVQRSMQCSGEGWSCLGVGDQNSIDEHWRSVQETIRVAHVRRDIDPADDDGSTAVGGEAGSAAHSQVTIGANGARQVVEYRDESVEAHYNDLFELLFTSTTPDVIARLLSHLDIGDIKVLRQTSSAVRLAVGAQRENVVLQFFSGIGYRTWTHVRGSATAYRSRAAGRLSSSFTKDPCPLTLNDVEAYMIGQDLLSEYSVVGREFARNPRGMDPGIALLARATTRAHNRVLTRLRLQPAYKQPSTPSKRSSKPPPSASFGSPNRASLSPATTPNSKQQALNRHNSYYAGSKHAGDATIASFGELPPMPNGASATGTTAPGSPLPASSASSHSHHNGGDTTVSTLPNLPSAQTLSTGTADTGNAITVSPWKPGRAAQFRVWVPARDPNGWLSDEELALCEQELYRSGIWTHLKRGDIVWDTAIGDKMNEGKLVFDGHYLRDLSYAYDIAGHLPSWLNVITFSPSYWHNVIKSSMPQPVVYIDVTPWKDQILNSLRLVQDQVDSFSGNGARYRIAKWLYRTAANVSHGQIISRMNDGLEIVDEGWHGRIVIEMDGTAEMAKLLVARCAGADATPQAKAQLLAAVMGDAAAAGGKVSNVVGASGTPTNKPIQYNRFGVGANGGAVVNAGSTTIRRGGQAQTSAWAIMRERSRPGLIWVRPLADRERVTG